MPFCDALKAAIEAATDDGVKAQLQAIYDQNCGGFHTDSGGGPGGSPTPPPKHQ